MVRPETFGPYYVYIKITVGPKSLGVKENAKIMNRSPPCSNLGTLVLNISIYVYEKNKFVSWKTEEFESFGM